MDGGVAPGGRRLLRRRPHLAAARSHGGSLPLRVRSDNESKLRSISFGAVSFHPSSFRSKPADWTVRIGVYDLSDGNSGADYRVSKFTLHPNHTSRYQRNDIALIKLTSPVGLKNDYRHICLPESGVQLEGENAYVVGECATACERSSLTL